jgi:hypothetical protein
MAGLGGKNWSFEEEVTSSDVNGYLADQVVMRFADTATRTAGFGGAGEPTLAEGMVSYLDDANRVDFYNGSAWKPVSQILQLVSTTKTDTFSTSSTTYTDATGLSVSITPSATSSKVFVIATIHATVNNLGYLYLQLVRGSTAIAVGDVRGSRIQASTVGNSNQDFTWFPHITYLDSPSTTSATTYKIQIKTGPSTGTAYINRGVSDTDNTTYFTTVSSITAIEVAG